MKRQQNPIVIILAAVTVTAVLLSSCTARITSHDSGSDSRKPQIAASFFLMADFARKIGGEHIQVTSLVPSGMEPHEWEPAAADISLLEQADVLIYNGAGMEHWIDQVASALDNKNLLFVETAKKIVASHAADPLGQDPHVWLSPPNAKIQLDAIRAALIQIDPANQADYQANYDHWAAQLDKLDQDYRNGLAGLPKRDIIVAHQAFGHLCAEYGLKQTAIEGLMADSEPDPARMAEIVTYARDHDITVIFFEELASPKVAETIAREIGARTSALNPLEGMTEAQLAAGEDYFSIMRKNLAALIDALS